MERDMTRTDSAPATAGGLMAEGTALLKAAGIGESALNCGWLLASALRADRLSLLADRGRAVTAAEASAFRKFLERKASGEPLAYIIGSQPFCGLTVKVDQRVLVPRPETEELVDLALDFIRGYAPGSSGPVHILDFGTGSGAIALALAAGCRRALVTAADKSRGALDCAEGNARDLGAAGRIRFVEASEVRDCGGPFDLIVTNPPYIPSGVIPGLDMEVRSEPLLALDGGPDGLGVAARIIEQAPEAVKKGGALFMEIGDTQARAVSGMPDRRRWKVSVVKDLCGKKRFLKAVRK